eukprot:scaffold32972_cov28-Tisochrysis_lutea.AAC.6
MLPGNHPRRAVPVIYCPWDTQGDPHTGQARSRPCPFGKARPPSRRIPPGTKTCARARAYLDLLLPPRAH